MTLQTAARRLKPLGPKRDKALWEQLVNCHWNGEQPVLSPEESIKAAKRLFRHAMGWPWQGPVKLVSGRRYTYVRHGVLRVNPDMRQRDCRGLRAMIHDLSHYCHRRLHPNDAPHSKRQAQLEGRLVRYAIRSGFLDGTLAPRPKASASEPVAKPKPDKVQVRYQGMCKRQAKWAAELERAKRLLAKATKERKAYERRHGARLQACA